MDGVKGAKIFATAEEAKETIFESIESGKAQAWIEKKKSEERQSSKNKIEIRQNPKQRIQTRTVNLPRF